jgi:hypothetical protein
VIWRFRWSSKARTPCARRKKLPAVRDELHVAMMMMLNPFRRTRSVEDGAPARCPRCRSDRVARDGQPFTMFDPTKSRVEVVKVPMICQKKHEFAIVVEFADGGAYLGEELT